MAKTHGRNVLHRVELLSAVGPSRGRDLRAAGVGSIEEFVAACQFGGAGLADVIRGLSRAQVSEELLPEACFYLLPGGPPVAAALVAAGITSFADLVAMPTSRVVSALAKSDRAPNETASAQLQLAAARASVTFRVLYRVHDAKGPVRSPTVTVAGAGFDRAFRPVTVTGDTNGWVLSPVLKRDRVHLLAIGTGRHHRTAHAMPEGPLPVQVSRLRFPRAPRAATVDAWSGRVRMFSGRETIVSVPVKSPDRLKAGTALIVGQAEGGGGFELTGALRTYQGGIISVPLVKVDAGQLPRNTAVDDVVVVGEDGKLKRVSATERRRILAARAPLAGLGS